MAYSDLTLRELEKRYTLLQKREKLFSDDIPQMQPSMYLLNDLNEAKEFPMFSEKAKSELMITPILKEIKRNNKDKITIFSGFTFNVNESLTGICDYLFTKIPDSVEIKSPVFCLVEAKNRAIEEGFGQCAGEMYAASLFNKQEGVTETDIYGCVTNGYDWLFLKLENHTILIDKYPYQIANIAELLGVFQVIIN
jgi:hypothetical protein